MALDDFSGAVGDGEFSITRVFDAPRDLVWKAFTEADRLEKWWGPPGCTVTVAKLEFRPGGTFLYGMGTPDGGMMWGKWTYLEIDAPAKFVTIVSFCDADENVVRHPMSDTWPLEMLTSTTLADAGDKTRMTITASAYHATEVEEATFAAGKDSMKGGFTGTMDQLDAYLATAKG